MANETKKKAGRPKKEAEQTKAKETVEVTDETTKALQDAMAMIAQLKGEIDTLKSQQPTAIVASTTQSKKVKCISLAHHTVNVYTQPDCQGKVFTFERYGQIVQMKVDELLDVLAYYYNTMASGLIYICDNDIIVDNGLEDAYQHIYDKDTMDAICLLRRECDAEFILNMTDDLRESTLIAIIKNYKNGEKMDATAMETLRSAGYDVVKMAEENKM